MGAFKRWRRSRGGADEGFTLIELIVSISLLAVLMSLVTAAILTMFTTVRKQQGQADAIDANRFVLEKLDKSVRYANAITTPGSGTTTGTLYVEWRTGNVTGATNTSTAQTCTQWRFLTSTGLLQSRSWTEGSSSTTLTSWFTQEVGVSALSSSKPVFVLLPSTVAGVSNSAQPTKEQLTVQFNATDGTQQRTVRATQVTLTASNTDSAIAPTSVCTDLGSAGRP